MPKFKTYYNMVLPTASFLEKFLEFIIHLLLPPNNGGQCCLWTVPAGAEWAAFEVWGGGGPGAGVCCCQQGWSGGSGSYGRRIIEVAPRTIYNLCRWINLLFSKMLLSCRGFPSYVCGLKQFLYVFHREVPEAASKCFWSPNCSYSGCPNVLTVVV